MYGTGIEENKPTFSNCRWYENCPREEVEEVRKQSLSSPTLECRLMSCKWYLSLLQSVLCNYISCKYSAFITHPSVLIIA